MNQRRINMYHLLARLYKKEVDKKLLETLFSMNFPSGDANDLSKGYKMLGAYLSAEKKKGNAVQTEEDLAVDFARTFLAAGIAKGEAAFPFESVYTSKKKIVMQEAWEEVKSIYATHDVGLVSSDGEYLEDHIGCELEYMAFLIGEDAPAKEQCAFVAEHLANWVDAFAADVDHFASTDFYKGLALLTKGFIAAEKEYLLQAVEEEKKASAEAKSFEVSNERFDEILKALSNRFTIYAPKRFMTGAGENAETIKYAKVSSLSEIVYDKQSDFSPKESYYPISQTMFYFTESEVIESSLKDDKEILVFARPCDINAMTRLDNVFLNNGGKEDMYYARLRNKVKIAMIECRESFEHCFCVSLNTNRTDAYDMAIRFGADCAKVHVQDEMLAECFLGEKASDFTPEFVTENKRKVCPPEIKDKETLKWLSDNEYWNKFDEKCIGCGGCNTVCGTCSCFDTVDIIYNEGSKEGERKRVWSSCMLEDFTQTAGGARARKTPGANMRFKTFHKFYDYRARFGGENHMCVGCGRCSRRCPQSIDFFETVNEVSELLSKREKEGM